MDSIELFCHLFLSLHKIAYPIIRDYEKPVLFNNKAGITSYAETNNNSNQLDFPNHSLKIQRHPSTPPAASPPAVPKIRKDFPETWLWETVTLHE